MNSVSEYLLVSIVSLLTLSSCEIATGINSAIDIYEYFDSAYDDQNITYQPSSFDEAWIWVSSNIEYKLDPEGGRKQSPKTTYALRTGDCEDYALLLSYFAYRLGLDVHVITGINSNGIRHAINRYNGDLVEPQRYGKIINPSDFTIEAEYTYKDAFYSPFIRSINN